MRKQNSACATIEVFCHSDPYKVDGEPYYGKESFKFITPTSDTRRVIKYAWRVMEDLFQMGVLYKKAGVRLSSLADDNEMQGSLFGTSDDKKSLALMKVVDEVNRREGSNTLRSMACGVNNESWKMRREYLSPRFVTGWSELPKSS
jgi:DNA polymerase V